MSRIIAIDCGQKRIGIAVTDENKIISSPLETVRACDAIEFLKNYIASNNVESIVVGEPKQLNNEKSESYIYVSAFLKNLKRNFPNIPVELYDERFTSKIAINAIIKSGLPKMKRRDKSLIDKVSAALLLQSYLEYKL